MTQDSSTPMAGDVSAAADDASDSLRANARRMVEQGAERASGALGAGRDYVERVRSTGQDYAGRAYGVGKRKAEEAAFYTELGYEEAIILVRRHPAAALGIAAGIGLLLGIVTGRRQ